jgi:pilin isopeptide linkage protein
MPGTYVYQIRELSTAAYGWIFDDTVYTLTIVIEERDGVLAVASKTFAAAGEERESAIFINRYDPTIMTTTTAPTTTTDPETTTTVPGTTTTDPGTTTTVPATDSTGPATTTANRPGDTPKTDDEANPILWLSLMMLGIVGLIVTVVIKKTKTSG